MTNKKRILDLLLLAPVLFLPPALPADDALKAKILTSPPAAQTTALTPPAQAASPLTLEALIQEALANNPVIQSAERQVAARRAVVPQVKTLPDPMVSVSWMGGLRPFDVMRGDPSSFRSLGAMQQIPFPGKLKLRAQVADRAAEATWWEYEQIRRRVIAEVKTAYYELFYLEQAIEITNKNKDLLEKLTRIAEVRYAVGQGIQQDVLRAQVELSRLLQRLTVLEQQKQTTQVRLNTLLYRPPDSPLGRPAPFPKAELTHALDALYTLALEKDPELHAAARLIEGSQYALNLAEKEYYPDFSVGFMYQNRPLMPEMYGVAFSVNIPIFYKSKQRAGVQQATEELISAQRRQDARKTELFFEVKEHYLAAKASDELARLFAQAIVPQSTLALESAMAAYEVGKVDFLTVLDSFITVLNYETDYYRELTNFQIALAKLEPLVGVVLTQ